MTGNKQNLKETFAPAAQAGEWTVVFGSEPIDLHMLRKSGFPEAEKAIEDFTGLQAGIGGVFNHNYIEVRNPDGNVFRRAHGVGLDENWEMTGGGRLVAMITGTPQTPFSADPIQRDDPSSSHPNMLQHGDDPDQARVVFRGSEMQVMQMYRGIAHDANQMNIKGYNFGLLGQLDPNSNSAFGELREGLKSTAAQLGVKLEKFDPSGWDIGRSHELDINHLAIKPDETLQDVKNDIARLERENATQLGLIKADNGVDLSKADLKATSPAFTPASP